MLELKDVLTQLSCKVGLFILAALLWLITLPTTPVEAGGYYAEKNHRAELSRPYFSNRQRRIDRYEASQPYYGNKDRRKQKANIRTSDDDFTASRKQIRRSRGDFE